MSRARREAEFERLTQALRGASEVEGWIARLQSLGEEGPTLATSLLRAYRHGALSDARWAALTGRPPSRAWEVDETIRRFWDAAAEAGLSKKYSVQAVGEDAGAIRRWAWQPRWILMEQDEDLLLMEDRLVPVLFAVAAVREVPKREYVLSIVAHHARDSCSAAFYRGAEMTGTLRRVAGWAEGARAVGAEALAEYLERLGRHAIPGPVDRAAVVQRLRDVARCQEPPAEQVAVVEVEGGFEGVLVGSVHRRLYFDATSGAVRFAASDRGAAGGRRRARVGRGGG